MQDSLRRVRHITADNFGKDLIYGRSMCGKFLGLLRHIPNTTLIQCPFCLEVIRENNMLLLDSITGSYDKDIST